MDEHDHARQLARHEGELRRGPERVCGMESEEWRAQEVEVEQR